MLDLSIWNNLEKPDECKSVAVAGDILEKIDGVLFLLQATNEANNIVAYRVEPSDKHIIWTFYKYIILLFKQYHIEYIRIEGRKHRYDFLKRLFLKKEVIQDKGVKERDVYYCHLSANTIEKLGLKCQEYEFYYYQKIYLTSENAVEKKKAFDKMFFMVKFAVENAMKKQLKGFRRQDFYDLVMDATTNVMARYLKPKGYYIEYLLTVAGFAALGVLRNAKQKFYDQQISYEAWLQYEYAE